MGESTILDPIAHELLYGDRLVPCYTHRPRNLDAMLRQAVAHSAGRPAIEDGDRRLSYGEFDREVSRVSGALAARGVTEGERVALFVGNRLEFIVLLFGIWRHGAVAVPIGVRQSSAELDYILNHCAAAALLFDASLGDRVPDAGKVPALRLRVRLSEAPSPGPVDAGSCLSYDEFIASDGTGMAPELALGDEAPACIMYTSGTTGRPKGAVLSHLGFFHTARHYERGFGYTADDRMLLVIPASHISGLLAVVVVMVQVGGCIVCLPQFKAEQTLREIEARRITATLMVPAMYNLCLLQPDWSTRDLSCWRIGHFGGAPMPEVTIQRVAELLPGLALYNGFGATETTSAVTLMHPGDAALFPDTVGRPVPCVDIRVLDEQGVEVAPGVSGELWIRSPGNAIGYWNDAEATRKGFVAGYWRSGDVGSVDAQGHVRVLDRLKDMINRGGYKVYCVELENVIQRFPGVIEVAAVGSPCPVLGERIHVYLHSAGDIDTDAVRALCREQLSDYKTPDFITVSIMPLPRNLNGKLMKAPLRENARRDAVERLTGGANVVAW